VFDDGSDVDFDDSEEPVEFETDVDLDAEVEEE